MRVLVAAWDRMEGWGLFMLCFRTARLGRNMNWGLFRLEYLFTLLVGRFLGCVGDYGICIGCVCDETFLKEN